MMLKCLWCSLVEVTYYDETALAVARRMAQLGVNLIVGYGPNAVQDHGKYSGDCFNEESDEL